MSQPPPGPSTEQPADRPATVYEAIGGEATFTRLVDAFYAGVAADPILRAIYPEDDLGPANERLRLFLIQYWGGPSTYSDRRGHPRLRMRHVPYPVNTATRDAWLSHMRAALDVVALPAAYDETMWRYFVTAAESLRNAPG